MENEYSESIGTPFIVALLLFVLLGILLAFVGFDNYIYPIIILLLVSLIRLRVSINTNELRYSVFPFVRKKVPLSEIQSFEIKKLNALGDFLGWGIRYSTQLGWAYIFFTKEALYLTKNSGKKLVLSIRNKEQFYSVLETAKTD